jgi:hypothetical protein
MDIMRIAIPSLIVLVLLVVCVCFCVEEAQRSRMRARAHYDAGAAAERLHAKARELEQQIYAEAMRRHNRPESNRDES